MAPAKQEEGGKKMVEFFLCGRDAELLRFGKKKCSQRRETKAQTSEKSESEGGKVR